MVDLFVALSGSFTPRPGFVGVALTIVNEQGRLVYLPGAAGRGVVRADIEGLNGGVAYRELFPTLPARSGPSLGEESWMSWRG